MRKRNTPHFVGPEVVISDPSQGLTGEQVARRTQAGLAAGRPRPAGKSEPEIIFLHIFTFFNLIFAVLALLLAFSGSTIKNMAFLIVAICNALIGIVQEIRAKRAVDALTLVAARDVRVIRDGQRQLVSPEAIVRDDIAEFGPGDQICADGILCDGALQADESLLTGEADPIQKSPGDPVRSGSVVIAGQGTADGSGSRFLRRPAGYGSQVRPQSRQIRDDALPGPTDPGGGHRPGSHGSSASVSGIFHSGQQPPR